MDAPTYPPASAFEQPLARQQALRVDNYSLAELMSIPEAWAIVVKHIPGLGRMVRSPMLKPHLGNFTVHTAQTFAKTATAEQIAAVDAELSRLPPPKW